MSIINLISFFSDLRCLSCQLIYIYIYIHIFHNGHFLPDDDLMRLLAVSTSMS